MVSAESNCRNPYGAGEPFDGSDDACVFDELWRGGSGFALWCHQLQYECGNQPERWIEHEQQWLQAIGSLWGLWRRGSNTGSEPDPALDQQQRPAQPRQRGLYWHCRLLQPGLDSGSFCQHGGPGRGAAERRLPGLDCHADHDAHEHRDTDGFAYGYQDFNAYG